jgi:transcriptional regulator with XRE-family HTH domain
MKKLMVIVMATLLMGLTACSSRPKTEPPPKPVDPAPQGEFKLIWSSNENNKRPSWTVNDPDKKDGNLFFVGVSGKFATEKEARDDSQRHATTNVVKYIGTFATDKFQRISTSYGLSSEITDPTKATRDFEEQLSSAFATQVKVKERYIEQWENKKMKESYYLVYTLAAVSEGVIEKTYGDVLDGKIEEMKKKRDEANEEKAKEQFDNAMKAFEEAKKQGLGVGK